MVADQIARARPGRGRDGLISSRPTMRELTGQSWSDGGFTAGSSPVCVGRITVVLASVVLPADAGRQRQCSLRDLLRSIGAAPPCDGTGQQRMSSMQPTTEYWAAMAQIMAVVALAVAVEARAVSSRWTTDYPTPFERRWLSLLWATSLFWLALAESQAIRGIRGVDVGASWAAISEVAVVVGLMSLLLIPAVDSLMRGNAESVAWLSTWSPLLRLQFRLLDWRATRILRGWRKEIADQETTLARLAGSIQLVRDRLVDVEAMLRSLDAEGGGATQETREQRPRLEEHLTDLTGLLEESEELRRQMAEHIGEGYAKVDAYTQELAARRARRAAEWPETAQREREERVRLILDTPWGSAPTRRSPDTGTEEPPGGGSSSI